MDIFVKDTLFFVNKAVFPPFACYTACGLLVTLISSTPLSPEEHCATLREEHLLVP